MEAAIAARSLEWFDHEREIENHGWIENQAVFLRNINGQFYFTSYSELINIAWLRCQGEFCSPRVTLSINQTRTTLRQSNFLGLKFLLGQQ